MNLRVYISSIHGTRTLSLNGFGVLMIIALLCTIVAWIVYTVTVSFELAHKSEEYYIGAWEQTLEEQDEKIIDLKDTLTSRISSLVTRMSYMQAELNRLDALGVAMAKSVAGENELAEIVSGEEFDNGRGGFETDYSALSGAGTGLDDFDQALLSLSDRIDLRRQQLSALNDYFSTNTLHKQVYPAGFPVVKGWVSSSYGYRISPFTGKRSFHYGIDIASNVEEPILAIASGVVVFSGTQYGYGNLIEIDHGNGYTTRYAHHRHAFVSKGDTVRKNDIIALIGNEGRSTGPHLHLEVMHNNKHINPLEFIKNNN